MRCLVGSSCIFGYSHDHIHPRSKGGANTESNCQLLLHSLNERKADRTNISHEELLHNNYRYNPADFNGVKLEHAMDIAENICSGGHK